MNILLAVDGRHVIQRPLSGAAAHDEGVGPGHDDRALPVAAAPPA